jgi:hypothetical protein
VTESSREDDRRPDDWAEIKGYSVLLAIMVPIFGFLLWVAGCLETRAPGKPDPELARRIDEFSSKLHDPRVQALGDAAIELGAKYKREGIRKPTDAELHAIALQGCDRFKIPTDYRGVAVDKFKRAFGTGYWMAR